jgi:ParB family chromosome partitioning protein
LPRRLASSAKAVAELEEQGVTVVEYPGWNDTAKTLSHIRLNNSAITDKKHKKCPGHAVSVKAYFQYDRGGQTGQWKARLHPVCVDPVEHGHLKKSGAGTGGDVGDGAKTKADEAARDERRRVIENNKAWRAATVVRREFVKNLIAKKNAPGESSWFIAMWLADPTSPASNALTHRHPVACELLGVEEPSTWDQKDGDLVDAVDSVGDGRAAVLALAMALGSEESAMTEQVWRRASAHHGRYLNFLAACGYELSEIEQSVLTLLEGSEDEKDGAVA